MNLLGTDIGTIIVLLILGNLTASVLLFANLRSKPGNRNLLTAKLLQSAAWSLIVMRGTWPDFWTLSVGNTLLTLALLVESWAISSIKSPIPRWLKIASLVMGTVAVINFWQPFLPQYYVIGYGSFFISFPFLLTTIMLLYYQRPRSFLQTTIGILCLLGFSLFVARGSYFIYYASYNVFNPIPLQLITLYVFFFLMIVSSVGFMMMEKEQLERALVVRATSDPLTGILTRSAFNESAEPILSLAARKSTPVSLLLMDLDCFKSANDRYGHVFGDNVLKIFTRLVGSSLRNYDLFGRYGGDEFIILLPSTGREDAYEVADRIRRRLESNQWPDHPEYICTTSIGLLTITDYTGELPTVDSLYRQCDTLLYQAKENGRNRICCPS